MAARTSCELLKENGKPERGGDAGENLPVLDRFPGGLMTFDAAWMQALIVGVGGVLLHPRGAGQHDVGDLGQLGRAGRPDRSARGSRPDFFACSSQLTSPIDPSGPRIEDVEHFDRGPVRRRCAERVRSASPSLPRTDRQAEIAARR